MSGLGYVEGRDYVIEIRSAHADMSRLPDLAAELVALRVDLVVAGGTPAALAASRATADIPILIATVGDPLGSGLVTSMAHPGKNVTGLTSLSTELINKRLDLLRQILPGIHRVGLLYDPTNPNDAPSAPRFESDCVKFRFDPILAPARNTEEIAAAFRTLAQDGVEGLIVATGNTNTAALDQIIGYAAQHHLPTMYGLSSYPEAGGLASYAADYADLFRRAAAFADKIFKGAKPGDLAIERPVVFNFVINHKTARSLGIEIPTAVMLQATSVIE
jgi:putative ABC transport system substrate-binding protein